MSCAIVLLHGLTVWLALIGLAMVAQPDLAALILAAGPLIVGAWVGVLIALDAALARIWG